MKITIFGAGKSGIAAAKRLRGEHSIFLTEAKKDINKDVLNTLRKLGIGFELGGHTNKALEKAQLIVVSPGVSLEIPILRKARSKGIPIIGEVELACRYLKKPIIAVTGTNGKTTTTTLIGEMLKRHGYKVAVAGNIGNPLISIDDSNLDLIVAEISSYQLETASKFRPWISIMLNITEDHLTRHRTMKEYIEQKAKIFMNQGMNDHLIFNYDDKLVRNISIRAKCPKTAISQKSRIKNGVYVSGDYIVSERTKIIKISSMKIKGTHNVENALAAIAAALICKVPPRSIRNTLMRFRGVEHRIEFVKRKMGVSYYNDSKGTNPDSTIVAINALSPLHDIVLILGGRDKMTDLSGLCKTVKNNVKDVVLIGEAKKRFHDNLKRYGFKRIHEAKNFNDAVKCSNRLAERGDAVLLSPACASFDMFTNFEERGKVFKHIVARL